LRDFGHGNSRLTRRCLRSLHHRATPVMKLRYLHASSISRALAPILAGCVIALGYIAPAAAVAPHAGPYAATAQPGPHALPGVTIDSRELFRPHAAEAASEPTDRSAQGEKVEEPGKDTAASEPEKES
ncbi:MAG: hypothetical protein ACR2QV_07840, partial [Gammaproteobacteria bacterium]